MKQGHSVCAMMVCISIVLVSSRVKPPRPPHPPGCASTLTFSSEVSSLSDGNGNINSRSLSPWRWRSTTDKNRIPSTLWEAECSNSSCSSPVPGQADGHDLNSVPIFQNVLVLLRQEGPRCYNATYRSVIVGCTCVWTRSKTQD